MNKRTTDFETWIARNKGHEKWVCLHLPRYAFPCYFFLLLFLQPLHARRSTAAWKWSFVRRYWRIRKCTRNNGATRRRLQIGHWKFVECITNFCNFVSGQISAEVVKPLNSKSIKVNRAPTLRNLNCPVKSN